MSISGALNNAASGLAASARLADTIANNVANAMTPGFGKRATELSSLSLGGYGSGVRVAGTSRAENPFLTAERRGMDAALGAAGTRSDTYERIMAAVGEPGSDSALSTLATRLETTLMSATASPQSMTKLTDAVNAARDLAAAVNRVADETVRLRTEADAEINRQVDQRQRRAAGDRRHQPQDRDAGAEGRRRHRPAGRAQPDHRRHLRRSSRCKVVKRDGDQVALYAQNGGVLLDGRLFALELHPRPERRHPRHDPRRAARRADAGPGRRRRAGRGRRRQRQRPSRRRLARRALRGARHASCPSSPPRWTATPTT